MSGGVFSKANRPPRPGAYTDFESRTPTVIAPATGSIVAIPLTHNWGPYKTPTLCLSYADFVAKFGSSDTGGHRAVKQAFQGEGLPGRGGAGAVLVYRFGSSSAAKAAKTLQNTTPANAIVLTALYEGAKGNDLRVTTQNHASDSTKNELLLYDGTTLVEKYIYTDTDITDLAAKINARSKYVAAGSVVSGTALAAVSSAAFTSGNSGDPAALADWTAMLDAIEPERFGIFVPYDLVDANVSGSTADAFHTDLAAWSLARNTSGKRTLFVVGGELDEDVDSGNDRAALYNDPNVVNVGVGSVQDANQINSSTGDPRIYSTSELAPRVAGIYAARGESMSATFGRLQGLTLLNGPVEADILAAFDGGTVVLAIDSNLDAPVRVEKSLSTYITQTDTTTPYLIYRNPKFMLTMHGLEREIQEYAESNVIGQLPVNDKTRQLLVGEMKVRLQNRVERNVIQPNPTVDIDSDPPPTDDDEFVGLVYGIKFGRSIEQVFNTIYIA